MKLGCCCLGSKTVKKVRAIEGARGAKAVEKMMVFTHVLRAKQKPELLKLAEEALDRLVRGLPRPEWPLAKASS